MIQVKCFESNELNELEILINSWLEENNNISIFDCKYQVGNTVNEKETDDLIEVEEELYYTCLLLFRIDSINV